MKGADGSKPKGGFNIFTDEDVQLFTHYLELCDCDPIRAFTAYRDQYIIPLRERLAEAQLKAKRRTNSIESDVDHFIDFIKKLGPGEDITFQFYEDYCRRYKRDYRFGDTKFYEIRPLAIKRILIDELPSHFSLMQAKALIKDNEWRISSEHIEDALKDQLLFVELPMTDDERRRFFRDDTKVEPIENNPIYSKSTPT